MRMLLTFGIVLSVLVALSSAACTMDKIHIDIKTKTKGCMYKGELHKMNTEWTANCEDCTCSQSGLYCCNSARIPSGYDQEACDSVFDEKSCTYKVTRKDDPSIQCQFKSVKG